MVFSGRERTRTFYVQVMLPAVKLAAKIQTSASDYELGVLPVSHLTTFEPLITDHLKLYKMFDIKSGKHLKPDCAVVADTDGVIGRIVMLLEPGLDRRIDGKKKMLLQPMFLVELNHPLEKRSKASA